MTRLAVVCSLLALFPRATLTLQAQAPLPSCTAPEHRQFDFWVGEWSVHRAADGKYAGQNRIDSVLGGCALHEQWTGAGGVKGNSYNAYDAARGVWHQTWVDNGGLLLQLDGGLQGDSMVLEGDSRDVSGALRRQRIRWTPNADGSVRQHWQSQAADGSWQTVFDGYYRRHVPAPDT